MSSTPLKDVLSNAKDSFETRTKLVNYLLRIHEDRGGSDRGRRDESFLPLNMSAMVLITACWEFYLETLLSEVFELLLDSDSYKIIPESLKVIVREKIIKDKADSFIDQLICQSTENDDLTNTWKEILKEHVKEKINNFHTLSESKVNKLFEHILGLKELSNCWCWRGRSNENVIKDFHEYLNTRHKIVHGNMNEKVVKKDAKDYLNIVEHLVEETEKKVKNHVKGLLKNQEVSE